MQFHIIETKDSKSITLFYSDGSSDVVPSNHQRFDEIVTRLREGAQDDEIRRLVNALAEAVKSFVHLSERITLRGKKLYFDGDRVRGPIVKHIIRMVKRGEEDQAIAVARFLEKLNTNPSEYAREHLYEFLDRNEFTIIESGDYVAYKGLSREFTSVSHGKAMVDGVVYEGAIPNPIGAVVEMPRSEVDDGAHTYCSTGLHAGTYRFARGFSRGPVAAILVNPRDVVSVPDDGEKLRVCRYLVLEYVDQEYPEAVRELLTDTKLEELGEDLADDDDDSDDDLFA